MFPYLVVNILNVICAFFADISYRKYKPLCWFWLALIILTCTVIYGLRDFGVGTDTILYTGLYFKEATYVHDWVSFMNTPEHMDKGYVVIAMISHFLGDKPQALLIFTEFFIITFFILGLYQLKKVWGIHFWIYIFIFCCLLAGYSLNLMRQFCAMSMLFFGFSLLVQKKWIPYVVIQILAYYIHSTSVCFLCVPMIYFMSFLTNIKLRNIVTVAGFILLAAMISSYFYFLAWAGDLGIITELYADRYSEGGEFATGNERFSWGMTIYAYWLVTLILIFVAYKIKACEGRTIYITFTMFIITTLLQQLNQIVMNMHRVSLYIAIVYYAYLSMLYKSPKITIVIKILGYMLFAYQWYKLAAHRGISVYPYTSKILGIG